MKKQYFILVATIFGKMAFAQGIVPTNELPVQPVQQIVVTSAPNLTVNTPASTGGASYDQEVVTRLDEYRTRKLALQEKATKMKLEQKKAIENEYRMKAYNLALAAAKKREEERMRAIVGKKLGDNSNQSYFDKQTKILMESN